MSSQPLKICYFGTYRANYVRNRLMIDRLRLRGFEVLECNVRLWFGEEDRQDIIKGGWKNPKFWLRVARSYNQLIWKFLHIGKIDVLMVGYPGHFDIPLARILSKILGIPLIWDVLMSIYLITKERMLDKDNPSIIQIIKRIEGLSLRFPDILIIDTSEYADWYVLEYSIKKNNIRYVPLGSDDRVFKPGKDGKDSESTFKCIYYGTFVNSHGVEFILESAQMLQEYSDIKIDLIGSGPEFEKILARADKFGLRNVDFLDWMNVHDLIAHIAKADVCLGTFGLTPQGLITVQNKIYECLAMAKPIITGDSPAMRRAFTHKKHVYLCQRESGSSITEAILTIKSDPSLCQNLSQNGFVIYKKMYSFNRIADMLDTVIQETVHCHNASNTV